MQREEARVVRWISGLLIGLCVTGYWFKDNWIEVSACLLLFVVVFIYSGPKWQGRLARQREQSVKQRFMESSPNELKWRDSNLSDLVIVIVCGLGTVACLVMAIMWFQWIGFVLGCLVTMLVLLSIGYLYLWGLNIRTITIRDDGVSVTSGPLPGPTGLPRAPLPLPVEVRGQVTFENNTTLWLVHLASDSGPARLAVFGSMAEADVFLASLMPFLERHKLVAPGTKVEWKR
jgi:hypothetical protein